MKKRPAKKDATLADVHSALVDIRDELQMLRASVDLFVEENVPQIKQTLEEINAGSSMQIESIQSLPSELQGSDSHSILQLILKVLERAYPSRKSGRRGSP